MDDRHTEPARTSDRGEAGTGSAFRSSALERDAEMLSRGKNGAVITEESASRSIANVPLEILREILSHTDALGLLSVSRLNKAFRSVVLSRSFRPVWTAAIEHSELPACAQDLAEPAYASLWLEEICTHCFGTAGEDSHFWPARVRLCKDCRTSQLVPAGPLAEEHKSKGYYLCAAVEQSVSPGRNASPLASAIGYKPHLEDLRAIFDTLTGEELAIFVKNRKVEVCAILEHAKVCKGWPEALKAEKQRRRVEARGRLKKEIKKRLAAPLGLKPSDFQAIKTHPLYHQADPKTLFQADWLKIHNVLEPLLLAEKARRLEVEAKRRDEEVRKRIWKYANNDATSLTDPYDCLTCAFEEDIVEYAMFQRFYGREAPAFNRDEWDRMQPEIQAESESRQERFLRTLHGLLDTDTSVVRRFCSVRSDESSSYVTIRADSGSSDAAHQRQTTSDADSCHTCLVGTTPNQQDLSAVIGCLSNVLFHCTQCRVTITFPQTLRHKCVEKWSQIPRRPSSAADSRLRVKRSINGHDLPEARGFPHSELERREAAITSLFLIGTSAMEVGDCMMEGLEMDELPGCEKDEGDLAAVKRKALLGPFGDIEGWQDAVQVQCVSCNYTGKPMDMMLHHMSLGISWQNAKQGPPVKCGGEKPRLKFVFPDRERPTS